MQTLQEMINIAKNRLATKEAAQKMGRELAADIVKDLKSGEFSPEMRKELNKERILALNLVLIKGGKYEN